MSDWLSDVIGNDLIAIYEGDVRMWVACNPMTPKPVLGKLAEDPVVFVRRGVAQNSSTPVSLLVRLNDDADVMVRVLASRKRGNPKPLFSR